MESGLEAFYIERLVGGFLWKFPGQAQASLVSQMLEWRIIFKMENYFENRLTGNDVRVGGAQQKLVGLWKSGRGL